MSKLWSEDGWKIGEINMSCDISDYKRVCIFEPLLGRVPPEEICDSHQECNGCPYMVEIPKEANLEKWFG